MVDLQPDRSMVRAMLESGLDVYLIDWGYPDGADRFLGLDDYINENGVGPVSFIKCDVEGHELPVFQGGQEMLRRDLPALLFECHDSEAESGELFSFLISLGYDGFFFHVTPEDHRSLLNKDRGEFVHYSEFANYGHVRDGLHHRNYVFIASGAEP